MQAAVGVRNKQIEALSSELGQHACYPLDGRAQHRQLRGHSTGSRHPDGPGPPGAHCLQVAAHKDIIDTIKKLLAENNLPHLLFYGPPGTGKTSTILAIARQIYGVLLCCSAPVLELGLGTTWGLHGKLEAACKGGAPSGLLTPFPLLGGAAPRYPSAQASPWAA